MLTRISDKEIREVLLEVAERYYDAEVDVTMGHTVTAQAQLETDQEKVKELFEGIERNCKGYEDKTVGNLLGSAFWQALKQKWIKEIGDGD